MIEIRVIGTPAPQGSKRFVGLSKSGRGILVESSSKVKPWREAVRWAAIEQGLRIAGPVHAEMIFTVPKPKSAPKRRKTLPDKKPDLDKICRATCDSLTDVRVIEDDSRIVQLLAVKTFPGEHADALEVPGAVIRIREAL